MRYIEVTFTLDDTGVFRDMLVDTLGNEGPYESFVETDNGLKAYVQHGEFDEAYLAAVAQAFPLPLKYTVKEMEDRDWNEEWERQHEAVLVHTDAGPTVWVRAPFHPHRTDVDYEVIIEPKMSFGTAHHPTTYMMLGYVAETPMNGCRVLDMGCGTAVLGILAKMRGAAEVVGIDIDDWAYRNAMENAATNHVAVDCRVGDASLLPQCGMFDIVIANINRNILMRDMPLYRKAMNPGATLLLSGFYKADEGALIDCGNKLGMTLVGKKNREGWSALQLKLKD